MHYANGRAAKAGDVVRGKGYNIKHEIVGLLVQANPGASACNCEVACCTERSSVLHYAYPEEKPDVDGRLHFGRRSGLLTQFGVMATLEYGQLDAFVALDPATGEVLAPEGEDSGSGS